MAYVLNFRINGANTLEKDRKEPWQDDSLCATVGTEIFFPPLTGSYNDAKKVCGKCTVREDCLRYIMNYEGESGVSGRDGMYAGLTPVQRHKLSKTYFASNSQESQAL